ncbi:P-loop containing nucleoside triphosphate hydrolase protein, partial [Paraphysoderma sedebokerense]
ARGNIAVRNIAQACVKWGFHKFRLIVSKEFYEEWHEAQYLRLEDYVLTSDQLDNSAKCRELEDCSAILCTVSMLHSDIFHQRALYKRTPTMLIVDEASQTHIGAYIPPLVRMGGLRKAVFIGDDKQLPPYGSEKIKILSIFDVYHPSHFLGTQYRLPRVIGDFISQQVYDGKLQTHDGILDSPNHRDYIRWVNVVGQEKAVGTSFENQKEAIQIVRYAQRLEILGRRYVILVPYDKQRHGISSRLKAVNIPCENRVFNVDSYQGQECDIVIVGVTRTCGVGFLKDERRTNVLLTRCTKAMVIVGHLEFVKSK